VVLPLQSKLKWDKKRGVNLQLGGKEMTSRLIQEAYYYAAVKRDHPLFPPEKL